MYARMVKGVRMVMIDNSAYHVTPEQLAFWADGHGRQPSVSRLYFCDKALNVYLMPLTFDGDFADPIPYTPGR